MDQTEAFDTGLIDYALELSRKYEITDIEPSRRTPAKLQETCVTGSIGHSATVEDLHVRH